MSQNASSARGSVTPPRARRTAVARRRLGAALALAAAAVATAMVVQGSSRTHPHAASTTGATSARTTGAKRPRAHFWIVRPGQTLSEIVLRTGVSTAEIERLNPGLNPDSLLIGQRVRVRP